ncbi:MAG: acetate--CoA ligase family protein [Desulfobacterales bacterium]|nr:acetate--CoA ligase family protein [Desulfobacterales bacterium]
MSLKRILNPESVAIVGASKDETKRGFQAIRRLLEEKYEGQIFPVNPKESRILGLKCYAAITDIKDNVDLAYITTPAKTLPTILKACGEKGVAGVIVIAGGFGETGSEGKEREKKLIEEARKNNVRLIGPNTSGMINVHEKLNLVGFREPPRGNIALLCQSGNMALTLMTEASVKSFQGYTYYIGVGNEADIRFHEYLDFFSQDEKTKAILMYVEGMRDGRRFLQQAYKTTREKPIILLKSGRTTTGKKSAGSHTGALAGISEVAKTAFKRAGIIVIENPDELFSAAETLANLPPIKNNKVAILADGGGHATIAADILSDLGVEIPRLSEHTQNKLRQILPEAASVRNPVDVAGGTDSDPSVFAYCAKAILKDSDIGGLLIVGLFGGYSIRFAKSLELMEEDAAHMMGKLVRDGKKPIVLHSLYSSAKPHSLNLMRYYKIPVYDALNVACKSISVLAEYGNYLRRYKEKANFVLKWGSKSKPEGKDIIKNAIRENRRVLLETEAKRLLQIHGAPINKEILATTAGEAAAFAEKIGKDVVLKIVSPDILHKSDSGGVRLHLRKKKDIERAFKEIVQNARKYSPGADIRGVLVAPMAEDGVEVIIGTKNDAQFGPVIMFGLGGIMVEILKDVSFRVLPISTSAAKYMIEEIRSSSLLNGFRGIPPCDKKTLRRLLSICSDLIESYPEIEEMDLNPLILHEEGLSLVDARIILKENIPK